MAYIYVQWLNSAGSKIREGLHSKEETRHKMWFYCNYRL